jgi:hypothetical protein
LDHHLYDIKTNPSDEMLQPVIAWLYINIFIHLVSEMSAHCAIGHAIGRSYHLFSVMTCQRNVIINITTWISNFYSLGWSIHVYDFQTNGLNKMFCYYFHTLLCKNIIIVIYHLFVLYYRPYLLLFSINRLRETTCTVLVRSGRQSSPVVSTWTVNNK